jgi:hypothetical protein
MERTNRLSICKHAPGAGDRDDGECVWDDLTFALLSR